MYLKVLDKLKVAIIFNLMLDVAQEWQSIKAGKKGCSIWSECRVQLDAELEFFGRELVTGSTDTGKVDVFPPRG